MESPITYVQADGARRRLSLGIFSDLRNAPFGRLSPKIAGSGGAAKRRLDKLLSRFAAGLMTDCVREAGLIAALFQSSMSLCIAID